MQYVKQRALGALLALGLFAAHSPSALAAGTASGVSISNSATVNYQVSGIDQTPLTSNTVTFVVDNRVDLTVAETNTTYVDVVPGSTAQVLSFTVTNTGNTAQDFALSAAPGNDPFGGTDSFDATNVQVFVESGVTPGYQPAEDTATFIDELAPDAPATVYIVADIPVAQVDGDIAAYTLTANAHDAGAAGGLGAETLATAGANTAGAVDVVLGDAAGDTDSANQGDHSDTGAYRVASAALNVTKSVAVISDPFNGATNPKAIPGATVRYSITVANTSATTAATNVVVVDAPPANTTYAAGSIALNTVAQTDAADSDESDFNATTGGAVTVTIPTVAAGGSATVTFDVTVD
jgi:uncharacterized repeat protein (TIGR01451 family)